MYKELIECLKVINKNNLWDDDESVFLKNIKKWSLKNHPDKGGDTGLYQNMISCRSNFENLKKFKKIYNDIISRYKEEDYIEHIIKFEIELQKCKNLNNNEHLQAQLTKCVDLGKQYYSENKQLKEDLVKLQEDLVKLQEELIKCRNMGTDCYNENKQLKEDLVKYQEELVKCRNMGTDYYNENKQLKEDLVKSQEDLLKTQQELKKLHQALLGCKDIGLEYFSENKKLKEKVTELEELNSKYSIENKELNKELNNCYIKLDKKSVAPELPHKDKDELLTFKENPIKVPVQASDNVKENPIKVNDNHIPMKPRNRHFQFNNKDELLINPDKQTPINDNLKQFGIDQRASAREKVPNEKTPQFQVYNKLDSINELFTKNENDFANNKISKTEYIIKKTNLESSISFFNNVTTKLNDFTNKYIDALYNIRHKKHLNKEDKNKDVLIIFKYEQMLEMDNIDDIVKFILAY